MKPIQSDLHICHFDLDNHIDFLVMQSRLCKKHIEKIYLKIYSSYEIMIWCGVWLKN